MDIERESSFAHTDAYVMDVNGNHAISTSSVSKQVKKKKESKPNRRKHAFVPRVWYEGKKMIIRGKSELKLSNHEIYKTLKKKEKVTQDLDSQVVTDNEVNIGVQPTLKSFYNVNKKVKTVKDVPNKNSTYEGGNPSKLDGSQNDYVIKDKHSTLFGCDDFHSSKTCYNVKEVKCTLLDGDTSEDDPEIVRDYLIPSKDNHLFYLRDLPIFPDFSKTSSSDDSSVNTSLSLGTQE